MKVSLNWLKEYTKIDRSIDDLVAKIGAQLGAVDEVTYIGDKYKGIVVAKVMSCESHPNADKLSVCMIDDGGAAKGVKRDSDGHIQIVCGAPNVRMGMLVAYCPPGALVPATYGKDPLKLAARSIRGVVSYGMLASAHELDINDNHDGILEIEEKVKPGTLLSDVYGLDDYIIDIENKMFTHRPDCFGVLGVAREIAGIQRKGFKSPDWYKKPKKIEPKTGAKELQLSVKNEIPKFAPRFMAVAISGVQVKPSPIWLQSYLSRVGVKPINNIVDQTNYYALLTGQPLHAYDYDKVAALSSGAQAKITVRLPKKGEKIKLLGGKVVGPRDEAVMIATDRELIGIGGVMGGADTEVDHGTKNIILECASFDKYSIHKTAMAHGLFTDAVTRFSKGQSPLQCPAVLSKAVDDIIKYAGGEVAAEVEDTAKEIKSHKPVKVGAQFIAERLGEEISASIIKKLLDNVEFNAALSGGNLTVTPPFWRTDIEIVEDIVEEVGRLYGYDHLPLELPKRDLSPISSNPLLKFKSELRSSLSSAGANEVLTYSFVPGDFLAKAGQDPKEAFQVSNALSPDLQYYRVSLTPGLLEKVHPNIKQSTNEFAIFEINKVHHKSSKDKEGLPAEEERVALVFAADAKAGYSGAPYYQAAKYLTQLLSAFGIRPVFVPIKDKKYNSAVLTDCAAPYEHARSAYVLTENGELLGVIGEFKQNVKTAFKLPDFVSGFELNVSQLLRFSLQESPYTALPRFPMLTQDICLRVKFALSYQELFDFVWNQLLKLQPNNVYSVLVPVDIYQSDKDKTHKQTTLRLTIASYERTLQAEAVNKLLDKVAAAAKTKFGAQRV